MSAIPRSDPASRPPLKAIPQLKAEEITELPATMIDDAGEWKVISFQMSGKKITGRIKTDPKESIVRVVKKSKEVVGYWHEGTGDPFFVSASGELMENVKVSGTVAAIPGTGIIGTVSKDELYLLIRETDSKKIIAAEIFPC